MHDDVDSTAEQFALAHHELALIHRGCFRELHRIINADPVAACRVTSMTSVIIDNTLDEGRSVPNDLATLHIRAVEIAKAAIRRAEAHQGSPFATLSSHAETTERCPSRQN